jgi:hypothetical protein
MRVRLTTDPDGAVCLESAYDRDFVEELKRAIDYGGRKWDPERKRWVITALYVDVLLQFLKQQGAHIQDDRTTGTSLTPVPPMPEDLREAFAVLHLATTAPLCVAEGSFKALSKYYHPDRGGDAEQFCAIGTAITIVRSYLDPRPEDADEGDVPF